MRISAYIFLSLAVLSCSSPPNKELVYDSSWEFKKAGTEKFSPASVPGVVHTDLLANGAIEDPYRDNNELALQWIENENWEYTSTWEVGNDLLRNDHIELHFEGLDTYAVVLLNEKSILEANNMFREWRVDVKDILVEGSNRISIQFTSPINKNKELVENHPYQLPSGNETVDLKVSPFTRKAAYQFGWDWGPRFVSMGIWRPINICTWNEARILDLAVSTKSIRNETALLEVEVLIESDISGEHILELDGVQHKIDLNSGTNTFQFDITIHQPRLWWPNGYGVATLHQMDARLLIDGNPIDQKAQKYGIRTIELINEPDSIGTSFFFKINNQPIFVKGANYIPQDIFPSRVTSTSYRNLIAKVVEANMNMLRLWGGGIYEDNLFYELCDENGILVWQDFMFAGSMYPKEEAFRNNIQQEVEDNIRRLRSHPALALWCGNNEIDVAWHNWGWQQQFGYSAQDSTELWQNYLQIFHEDLPNLVKGLTPNLPYVTTSPLSNWGKAENFNHSSMHYWGVWHGREPLENFNHNVPRFMAEYGFQSFPGLEILSNYIDSSQLHLESEVINNRQKSYIGNEMITRISEEHFGPSDSFEDYVLKSQQTQTLAMETAIKAHRLGKPHCMGTLFWQLNDCWPGPSWSVLQYDSSPKLAYETVKKWYQPVVAIPKREGTSVLFTVVSDRPEPILVKLIVDLLDDMGEAFSTAEVFFEIGPNEIIEAYRIDIAGAGYNVQLVAGEEAIFTDSGDFASLQ